MLRLSSTNVLIMYLPLFQFLSCWFWASMYCWNRESFMSNLLCFTLQLILNFVTLIHVSAPSFCHSRENFVFHSCLRMLYKKKLFWVKSNLWSRQDKTIEIYSYSDYWFMWKIFYPVQYFTQICLGSSLSMYSHVKQHIWDIYDSIFCVL